MNSGNKIRYWDLETPRSTEEVGGLQQTALRGLTVAVTVQS